MCYEKLERLNQNLERQNIKLEKRYHPLIYRDNMTKSKFPIMSPGIGKSLNSSKLNNKSMSAAQSAGKCWPGSPAVFPKQLSITKWVCLCLCLCLVFVFVFVFDKNILAMLSAGVKWWPGSPA